MPASVRWKIPGYVTNTALTNDAIQWIPNPGVSQAVLNGQQADVIDRYKTGLKDAGVPDGPLVRPAIWRRCLFVPTKELNRMRSEFRILLDIMPVLIGDGQDYRQKNIYALFRKTHRYRQTTTDQLTVEANGSTLKTPVNPLEFMDFLLFKVLIIDACLLLDPALWIQKAKQFLAAYIVTAQSRGRVWPWSDYLGRYALRKSVSNREPGLDFWKSRPDLAGLLIAHGCGPYAEQLALTGFDLTECLAHACRYSCRSSESHIPNYLQELSRLLETINQPLQQSLEAGTLNPVSWSLKQAWYGVRNAKREQTGFGEKDFESFIQLHMTADTEEKSRFLDQARRYLKNIARITVLDLQTASQG